MMLAQSLTVDWSSTGALVLLAAGVFAALHWLNGADTPKPKPEPVIEPDVRPEIKEPGQTEPVEETYLREAPVGFREHVQRILQASPGASEEIQLSYCKRGLREIDVLKEELNRLTVVNREEKVP